MSLISRLWRAPDPAVIPPALPAVPPGGRLYAFGDVHGRADLVSRLLDTIHGDAASLDPARILVIGLGDYIDRGPDSRQVIEAFLGPFQAFRTIFLKGNHEAMFLDFLSQPSPRNASWLDMGGAEFLQSYGVRAGIRLRDPAELGRIRREIAERLPPEHLEFFSRLTLSQIVGDYFFAHAGARPGVPLSEQDERDLTWIRGGFADRDEPFEKVVVHGHTPTGKPFLGRHRINLDTGAYATGRLTCLVLQGSERRILEITA